MPEQNNGLRDLFEQEMKAQQRSFTRQGDSYNPHHIAVMWWAAQWGYDKAGGHNGKVS